MRVSIRKAGVACGTLFASTALVLSTATGAGASSSALVIGGIATPTIADIIMAQVLGDQLHGQQRVSVEWPAEAGPYTGSGDLTLGASINVGITNMNTQIAAALARLSKDGNGNYINGEKVTVVGLSAGSLVVNEVLRGLAANPNAPDKDQITFIVVADSSRQKLIDKAEYNPRYDYTYQPAPETEYDIIVVTGEYDGMADFPDRPWNFLAVFNAIVGGILVHVPTMFADLDDVPAENISETVNTKGGKTTSYLIPTEKLPLVQLMPWLAPREAELKAKIDKAYARNDVATVPTSVQRTLVAPAPEAVEEETVVPEEAVEETVVDEVVADSDEAADDAVELNAGSDDSDSSNDATKDDVEDADVEDADVDAVSANDDDEAEATEEADDASAQADKADAEDEDSDDASGSDASDDSPSDDAGSSDSSDSSE